MNDDNDAMPDGAYVVLIIDAEIDAVGVAHLTVVVVAGEWKGRVASIKGRAPANDPVDLMGMPGVLSVRDGVPSLTLD